ncbi:BLOC-1-related complex subunit 6-like isoform X2 [Brienomyrus brachyistius]|nr:BLOC-1-related complex subunit 6-like isoform X2 [Brienomyrus brachyistius]XP_048879160.1 BLOC-1-related complex subunit 6-like isoform X2 [Brienomyrus brachyistius]XP_048879162.1 BLOC-1-related complex subunit 6-like isoform X2 [Brienomyrus brachyistius]XP_048879163.1 BLOC-1-related complex subunit 6-like isoform X2 [Brienomyrus brachyistius]
MSHYSGTVMDLQQAENGMETPEPSPPSAEDFPLTQKPLKSKVGIPRTAAECKVMAQVDGTLPQNGIQNCEGQYVGGALEMPHPSTNCTHMNTLGCPLLDKGLRAGEEDEDGAEEELSLRPAALETLVCASPTGPCPPHVMAQVRVRNPPERERIVRGMQDSKSLDEISHACGGAGTRGRLGQPEGRRATISSALELEGTVSHEGDLTHFITRNLEHKIKMSSRRSLDSSYLGRSRGSLRRPADIPPIDPGVLLDLQRHTQEVAHSVELMMRSLNGTIQNMTALSVGYIQTYRDSVDSLGEAVDMSIKGMYTLMARCEELDRCMQPIHVLGKQIRAIKHTLDAMESLCK